MVIDLFFVQSLLIGFVAGLGYAFYFVKTTFKKLQQTSKPNRPSRVAITVDSLFRYGYLIVVLGSVMYLNLGQPHLVGISFMLGAWSGISLFVRMCV